MLTRRKQIVFLQLLIVSFLVSFLFSYFFFSIFFYFISIIQTDFVSCVIYLLKLKEINDKKSRVIKRNLSAITKKKCLLLFLEV